MSHSDSLQKLVNEARHLRDHLLRVEGQDNSKLAAALQPFSKVVSFDDVTESQIRRLRVEFQNSYDGALKAVEGYTLQMVLRGYSPHNRTNSVRASVALALFGIILVLGAFHFTRWSNQTTFTLNKAAAFVEFDHFTEMMKLVELANYFGLDAQKQPDRTDLEPQLVYLEGISKLSLHYSEEQTLPVRMIGLANSVNPITALKISFIDKVCALYPQEEQTWTVGGIISCSNALELLEGTHDLPSPDTSAVAEFKDIELTSSDQQAAATKGFGFPFHGDLELIDNLQKVAMESAGRVVAGPHTRSRFIVRSQMEELKEQLKIVHLWALPIIYGALGSIVHCMWRVLNANVSALGFWHATMRTAFAGLAALTLSMLLVPTNIINVGTEMNRPMIYLMSFIFGYSVEAFVSTLNLLNSYLTTNLTPKSRK